MMEDVSMSLLSGDDRHLTSNVLTVKEEHSTLETDCKTDDKSNSLKLQCDVVINNGDELNCKICNRPFVWNNKIHGKLELSDWGMCWSCHREECETKHLNINKNVNAGNKCGKSFSSKRSLNYHKGTHMKSLPESSTNESNTVATKIVNTLSSMTAVKEKALHNEVDNESGLQKADATGNELFSLNNNLEVPVIKPYKCNECEMSFSLRHHLKYHERIHSGIRPYKCNECDKSFTQLSNFKRHERIHAGIKPYKCNECDKSFTQRSHLNDHKLIHSGIKPYKCNECDKSFSLRHHLKDHERLHSGIKPYKCNECDKSFSLRQHLKYHERIHSDIKPFKCSQCDKIFSQHYSLKRHERRHTLIKP